MKTKLPLKVLFQKYKIIISLPLVYLIFSGLATFSANHYPAPVTYTTINNGNWTNNTNVWSTDGINPCNCKPANTVNSIVIIDKNINLNANISISNGGSITVLSNGILGNSNFSIQVVTGILDSDGIIDVKELTVGSNGTAKFHGPLTANTKLIIEGIAEFNSVLSVTNTSIEFKQAANISAGADWIINISNGNTYNEGMLTLGGTCLKLSNGSFYNLTGASVSGNGYIETQNGNVYNNGSWSVNVDWCASGSGSGLPIAENCNAPVCNAAPLPVTLLYFQGTPKTDLVLLEWSTASELNNDYFTIQRSDDGIYFEEITEIDGAGNSHSIINYSFIDMDHNENTVYYSLSQTDFDGSKKDLYKIAIKTFKDNYFEVYPNPMAESVFLKYRSETDNAELIVITDLQGRKVETLDIKDAFEFYESIDISGFDNGIYFVNIMSNDAVIKTSKVVKTE